MQLALGISDRPVNLVEQGVDCVIRIGELKDSSMVARRIGTFESIICAAPNYLARAGEPQTIDDLTKHQAVHYFSSRTGRAYDWEFIIDGVHTAVKLKGSISVNDGDAYLACGLQGFGLIQTPRFMALNHLASGALRQVLPDTISAPMPISVVYPHNRHLSSKVRVFVDWVADLFMGCPLLGNGVPGSMENRCGFAGEPADNTYRAVIEQNNLVESVF